MTISTDLLQRLPDVDDPAFAFPFDRHAAGKVALLGKASPKTSEFYRARAAITLCLVKGHGLTIVGLHADWPRRLASDPCSMCWQNVQAPSDLRYDVTENVCLARCAALQKRSCASSYGKQPSDLRNRISDISTR